MKTRVLQFALMSVICTVYFVVEGRSQPPVTQPPVTQPPVTQPPVTQPPVTQPPVTQPPVTQPPVTQPPVTQPPVTQPPVTQPPVTQPPVTQPQTNQSSAQPSTQSTQPLGGNATTAIPTVAIQVVPQSAPAVVNDKSYDGEDKGLYDLFAVLLWPAVTLFTLIFFNVPIREFLRALTRQMQKAKVSILGVEIEVTHIENTEQFKQSALRVGDRPEITGDPNMFTLLCKASNSRLTKSTKVMNLATGCLIQVSTREVLPNNSIAVAEALEFVPGLRLQLSQSEEAAAQKMVKKIAAKFVRIEGDASPKQ